MANVKVYSEASVACRNDTAIAAGLGNHLPIGSYSGADYRSAIRFALPAWGAWTAITKATITVYISDHQHVGPVNSDIYCSRMNITSPIWTKSAGSQSCENGFTGANNTQADDIQSVSTDRVSFTSGSTANATKTIDVTAAVRYYWGSGTGVNKPVFVFDNVGSGDYTELWAHGKSGYDSFLSIDYETNTPPNAPTLNSPVGSVTVQSTTPDLNFTPSDPQGNVCPAYRYQVATDAGFTSIAEDQTVSGSFPNGVAITRTVQTALVRGATYWWRAVTSDAVGYGAWSGGQPFVVKAAPVLTIKVPRKMTFLGGAPRLIVEWTCDQPQAFFQVDAPGYTSGFKQGGDQSWVLDTLALTNGTPVVITVNVWNTDATALQAVSSRSFTPRWGLTTHKRTLSDTPVNWQSPTVGATVPKDATNGDCQLIVEYGTAAAPGDAAPTGWFTSFASVPKTPYLHWRAWFIPNHVTGPTLDNISIGYDKTVAVLDKWGQPVWPWESSGALSGGWTVDTGEAVFGTRSLRVDVTAAHYISSNKMKVREGRSYTLSGLMRSQGASGCHIRLLSVSPLAVMSQTVQILTPSVLTDWTRFKANVWKAPADMDVYIQCVSENGTPGAVAWFDGIKLEESIIATPWNPASVGATTLDAGGIQIDATKGGVLRYKAGTPVRALVEGGGRGLKFGGDPVTELFSNAPNQLHLPVGADLFSSGGMASGAGGSTSGYWWKVMSGVIPYQYGGTNFIGTAMMQGTYGQNMSAAALVSVSVYQGNPMGQQPTVSLRVLGTGDIQPRDFKVVVTSATGASGLWEFWMRAPYPYFAPMFKFQQVFGWEDQFNLQTYPNGPLVAGASAGTAYLATGWADESGTSFPAYNTPMVGQRVWRTDDAMEYYYDTSGRWLSTQLFIVPFSQQNGTLPASTANGDVGLVVPLATGRVRQIHYTAWNVNTYAGAPNGGANSWSVSLFGDATGSISSFNTASDVAGAQTKRKVALNYYNPYASGEQRLNVIYQRNGTPGIFYVNSSIEFRVVG